MPTSRSERMWRVHGVRANGSFVTTDFSGDYAETLSTSHFNALKDDKRMICVFEFAIFHPDEKRKNFILSTFARKPDEALL